MFGIKKKIDDLIEFKVSQAVNTRGIRSMVRSEISREVGEISMGLQRRERELREMMANEKFIDDIVERIQRKQL